MENLDIISKIIEAEQAAQKVADEAKHKHQDLSQKLEAEMAEMRDKFITRAQKRVETVRLQETETANEDIARIEAEAQKQTKAIESHYDANRDQWIEHLLRFLIRSNLD